MKVEFFIFFLVSFVIIIVFGGIKVNLWKVYSLILFYGFDCNIRINMLCINMLDRDLNKYKYIIFIVINYLIIIC